MGTLQEVSLRLLVFSEVDVDAASRQIDRSTPLLLLLLPLSLTQAARFGAGRQEGLELSNQLLRVAECALEITRLSTLPQGRHHFTQHIDTSRVLLNLFRPIRQDAIPVPHLDCQLVDLFLDFGPALRAGPPPQVALQAGDQLGLAATRLLYQATEVLVRVDRRHGLLLSLGGGGRRFRAGT